MPEGNEIHRWAERHNAAFAGKKLRVESPNGRFPDAAAVDNQTLERVLPRASTSAMSSAKTASCTCTSAATATGPKARCR